MKITQDIEQVCCRLATSDLDKDIKGVLAKFDERIAALDKIDPSLAEVCRKQKWAKNQEMTNVWEQLLDNRRNRRREQIRAAPDPVLQQSPVFCTPTDLKGEARQLMGPLGLAYLAVARNFVILHNCGNEVKRQYNNAYACALGIDVGVLLAHGGGNLTVLPDVSLNYGRCWYSPYEEPLKIEPAISPIPERFSAYCETYRYEFVEEAQKVLESGGVPP